MTIQTNHIDFFMGSDMVLVKPGYVSVLPINRPATAIDPTYQRYMNAFDIAAQNTVYTWVYQTTPASGIPGQMHVVGNPVDMIPLRLGVPGNNIVTVLPPTRRDLYGFPGDDGQSLVRQERGRRVPDARCRAMR